MAIIERIVTVYNDKGSKQALNDLKKLEATFTNSAKKIAKAFGAATVAAAALATKLAVDGVQAAIADQKSQALLANALRNTTGANEAAIASVEGYIAAQQKAVAVTDDELRPSLATLVNATKDVTQAQSLQNLALDISAGTQKDLQTVSLALAKAVGGNIGALTKLGVPLSADIRKSKDLNGALQELSKTFAGAASTRAQTFEGRMTAIRIAFGEALESLGYALIPVLENLAQVFQTQLIPVFEQFIANNKDQIAQTLGDAIKFAIGAAKAFASLFKTISDNLTTFKVFAGILTGIFVGTKVYAGIVAVTSALALLTQQFKRQAVAGTAAGTATAFATGGASALAAAAGLTAFAAAAGVTWLAINKLTDGINVNTSAMNDYTKATNGHIQELGRLAQATSAANLQTTKGLKVITTANAKTKAQILLEKTLAALKKKGIVPTSSLSKEAQEAINLEAARLNQIKQGNLEEARRVEQLMKNFEAQMKVNEAAQRYADLLTVLSDQTISSQEVSVLAQKWGITTGQVLEYIARIYAAGTTDISDAPIVNLLMKWGLTKQEAEKYVDFTRALKDEKIDDKEVEELMRKWGMTRAEVYAYARTVQSGTAFSSTWDDPGKLAEQAWIDALAALNAYVKALGGIPTTPPSGAPSPAPSPKPSPTITSPELPSDDTLPIVPTIPTPSYILPPGVSTSVPEIPSGMNIYPNSSYFAGLAATAPYMSSSYFAGLNMSDFASTSTPTVTVNVTGSVISEGDLTEYIRDGLLNSQGSGKPLLYNRQL